MPSDAHIPASPPSPPATAAERAQDPLALPPDPAEREDVAETPAVDRPEQDVRTLDADDYLPTPSPAPRPTPSSIADTLSAR
jgi:hypothetical protein